MGSVSLAVALPGHRNETMSLDSYTQNIPLTQKARFWSNYVSALKGPLALDYSLPCYTPPPPSLWSLGIKPRDITLYDLLYGPGSQDLRAPEEAVPRTWHPSIIETLPNDFPDLKHEFGKLESQMFDHPRRRGADPLSPVLPDARDRIFSPDIRTVQSILRSMEHTELEPSELEQEYPVYISLICDETLASSQGSIRVSINV